MTEIDEARLCAYADGELPTEQQREVETLLVRSERARRLLVALREEDGLIRDSLLERSPVARARPRPAGDPARGLLLGLGPSLAVGLAVTAATGWLLEREWPGGFELFNPLTWIGAYEMTIDLVFWLRDEAGQLFELAAAVAVTASVSALLTFALGVVVRRVSGFGASLVALAAMLFVALAAASPARALELRLDEETHRIGGDERVDDSLVVSGESVYVDGLVDGDLAAMADRVLIRGTVRGDVFVLAESVDVLGRIEGSLRGAAQQVNVEGEVSRGVAIAAEHLTLTSSARIGRDLTAVGEVLSLGGRVGRHFFGMGKRVELRGVVGGDAEIRGDQLALLEGAVVEGVARVALPEGVEAEQAPGARVAGGIEPLAPMGLMAHKKRTFPGGGFWLASVVLLTSGFLLGMLLHVLVPGLFEARLETSPDFFRSLGMGLVALIGTPLAIALAALTVVGIPLALVATGLYLVALFVALTAVAAVVGRALLRRTPRSRGGFGVTLLTGLVVVLVAAALPYVGHVFQMLGILLGLGLLVDFAWDRWRGSRGGALAF